MSATPARPLPLDVLVVDDEPDVRDLLMEYFRSQGMRVASARDGLMATNLLEGEPGRFGLVVSDLQLPGVDGFAVLEAAKRANPSCFVVIITGYASLESAIKAVQLGAYDYLTKPFSLGQIDVILSRLRDRLALEAENRRLARQAAAPEVVEVRQKLMARLESIDARLARLESAVSTLLDRPELTANGTQPR